MNENKWECTHKMTEMEDRLAALTTRLKDLEMQVGQLGQQAPLDTTAATQGPSSTTPAIQVSVPHEKRFGKYGGVTDDRALEDWISDAQCAVRGQRMTRQLTP